MEYCQRVELCISDVLERLHLESTIVFLANHEEVLQCTVVEGFWLLEARCEEFTLSRVGWEIEWVWVADLNHLLVEDVDRVMVNKESAFFQFVVVRPTNEAVELLQRIKLRRIAHVVYTVVQVH